MESGRRVAGNMSDEILDRVIDQFAYLDKKYPKDALRVGMQGLGEPLLYPRFFEVISMIRERMPRAYIHVNTNGILLNEENIERLVESELNEIIVGMNECDADDYKNCRGADAFDLVKTNTERLLKRRKGKLRIIVQLLNTCFNRPKIKKFRSYWARQGAKVEVKPFYPRPQWVLQLMTEKYRQKYDKYLGIEQNEMELHICRLQRPARARKFRYDVMVNKDGYIFPCIVGIVYTPSHGICLGNIAETSIEEAYNRKVPRIMELLTKGMRNEIDACSTCIGAPRVIAAA